jgi:hypothetical protein
VQGEGAKKIYWRTRRMGKMINGKLFYPDVCKGKTDLSPHWNKD